MCAAAETKLRIAWFSPLEAAGASCCRSAAAYVTNELLPLLGQKFAIDVFSAESSGACGDGVHLLPYSSALACHNKRNYDVFFYQIEDSAACDALRLHQMLVPGVVLFHDVLMRPRETEYSPLRCECAAMFEEFLGRAQAPAAVCPGEECAAFAALEARAAAVPLFSCERNLFEYRRLVRAPLSAALPLKPDAYYLPYPVRLPGDARSARPEGAFRCAFSGSTLIEHHAHVLLAALNRISHPFELTWLLDEVEAAEAAQLCAEFGVGQVQFVMPRSFEKWREVLSQASAAVHLLFSAYGDPGPWLNISLQSGVPCIVNDFAAAAFLPADVAYKVPCGQGESDCLLQLFNELRHRGRKSTARAGAAYAAEYFLPQTVAAELALVFERSAGALRTLNAAWFERFGRRIEAALAQLTV